MPRDSESTRQDHVKGEENIDPAGDPLPGPVSVTATAATAAAAAAMTATAATTHPLSSPTSSLFNSYTTSTLHPPPAHTPKLSLIERYLHLTALTPTTFTNTYAFWQFAKARGIYGGEIIGQCIVAAAATVADAFWLHSIHSYFVLAGDAKIPITYEVTNVRTGRSFATREVKALQRGQPIAVLMASFQCTSPTKNRAAGAVAPLEWEAAMPEVPKPWELPSEQEKIKQAEAALVSLPKTIAQKKTANPGDPSIAADVAALASIHSILRRLRLRLERDPFEWRALGPWGDSPDAPTETRKVRYWVRARERLSPVSSSGIPHAQHAALAYLTDNWFIGTVVRVNPAATSWKNLAMMVSLDHTVYFHAGFDTRVDEAPGNHGHDHDHGWLLTEMDAPWVAHGRSVVTQRVWRASDGRLLATCFQEGLVRFKDADSSGEIREDRSSRSSKL